MRGFLDAFMETLGQYLPSVLGALIILIGGWFLVMCVRKLFVRLLKKLRLDERISQKSGQELNVEGLLAGLVYYVLLLFVLLLTLEALGVSGVLDPVKEMFSSFMNILPNLLAAILIGVVGYVIAKILANAILVVGKGLDELASRAGLTDKIQLARLVSQIVFVLIFVPVLISAIGALKIEVISVPATEMLGILMAAIPDILAAAIILAVAYVVGRFVTNILAELLKNLGADALPEKIGARQLLGADRSFSRFCAAVAFFFIMLAATVSAAEKLSIGLLAGALDDLLSFAGQIALGMVILAVGNYLATLAYNALSRHPDNLNLAKIARLAILGLVLAMGLKAMGIADDIVNLAFGLTLGSVAVAVALSFGLGGREAAGRQMEYWLGRLRKEK
ncbi:MAG: mechanosensitive ion channel [Syntrophotalea acetylenica]|jgi:hypothetical protein|uniref:Uncharacterized protein n=1 Tax=Syntrophotalea acetylenica TaxID=29542 RepID=A0A1L3GGF1_SYNAC|nr:mechanosensitive ion channel [Syntrophotalea acetylenica]APG24996.1 hypothetical protein A7E75_08180 [Syntrophotalea acetylenica]APG43064.1 hypothetical protein A6070_02140 [Syntrophotalea acetylenica]MDD4456805.1 mechanosensitive ion channel [Syntrophotalea acetylenica]MDY0261018.1 mechanosensitive ion channel [Syntrophotalea acetylenica]